MPSTIHLQLRDGKKATVQLTVKLVDGDDDQREQDLENLIGGMAAVALLDDSRTGSK